MKFRFRLERVLHIIRLRETVKKMEVSAQMKRVEAMLRRCEKLRSEMQLLLSRVPAEMEFAPYAMAQVQTNAEEVVKLQQLIDEENEILAKRKAELSRLFMKRKAAESLREKRLKEFQTDENRGEQKRLDEIAARRRWGTA